MVQSRVEDLSPVVKKVSVELTPDRVKDALDRAYTSVSRTVKLRATGRATCRAGWWSGTSATT